MTTQRTSAGTTVISPATRPRRAFAIAPRTPDEAQRLGLLGDLGILDTAPEPGFDGLTGAAALLTGCPIALVSLLDQDRQWFKSATGLLATETPIAHSFCAHAVWQDDLFEIEDTHTEPRFAGNPLVTGTPHIRFYAGQPLVLDGVNLGTLCVIDTRPRKLSDEVRRALGGLAHAAAQLIGARRSELALRAQQRRMADIALASGDWLWDSDRNHRIGWSATHAAPQGEHDLLVEGAVLPDGLLLDGRGQILRPPVTFHSLLTAPTDIVRATIALAAAAGTRHLSFSAVPCFGDDGALTGFRGTARDVSSAIEQEQRRFEADLALRLERDSAQRSARLRSELVSRVSHELRTPLNAVLGFSQLLLRDSSDPTFYAAQINRAATHLLGLVNDMLDLARLESGREVVDLRSVPTLNVVKRCIELLEAESRRRDVTISWAIAPGADGVRADLRGLTQVLLNLLSNAMKCSARGGKVRVSARNLADGRWALDVSDDGPGIAAELLPVLFQPFSRLPASGKRDGTGLGLSISRQLVDAMGGDISVQSKVGKGSCFTVTLQAAELNLSPASETDFSSFVTAQPTCPLSPALDVLYIEDDPVNALVLDRMMGHLGNVRLHHADTARQGREMAASLTLDLILLDMNLPDGHGLEVLQALRDEMTTRIPVVALSADALPEAIALARASGFDDYLTKPIDLVALERLLITIRSHITAKP